MIVLGSLVILGDLGDAGLLDWSLDLFGDLD
jgi:hypothetical protein